MPQNRALVLTAFVCVTLWGDAAWADPSPTLDAAWAPYVQVQTVNPKAQEVAHRATGRLTYDEDHTQVVSSPMAGRVLKVHVRLGDAVAPNSPLVTLASPEAAQLWGEVQRATLGHKTILKQVARARALARDGAISEREVQSAEAELLLAQSSLQSAQGHLQALGLTVHDGGHEATLRAHVAGTITQKRVAVGQEVRADAAEPLLTVSNLGTLWLISDIFEQDLDQVAQGAGVTLQVPAYPAETFTGAVEHIADFVDAQSRTIKVRCRVDNPKRQLKPDMFAAVSFSRSGKASLYVPASALVSDGEAQAVVVVGEHDVLQVRRIVAGPLMDGQYRIIRGIEPGERVITRGAPFVLQNLRD